MKTSDQMNELAPALIKALGGLKNPAPDARGQVRGKANYAYLSLPALLDGTRSAFRDAGLAVLQEVVPAEGGVGVVTRIIHSLSGQYIETGPCFIPAQGGPQDFGSAISYGRRYALAAAVGVAADEDDDGAKAQRSAGEGHTDVSSQSQGGRVGTERTTPADGPGGVATGGGHTEPEAAPSGRSLPPHPFEGDGLVCTAVINDGACNYTADWPGHSKVRVA